MIDSDDNHRVFNFSAGPSTLPLSVLKETRDEFVDYKGSGMSLIEMSHRGAHFMAVHEEAKALAKRVFRCPDDFEVLFVQGGATLQFAMVPINFLKSGNRAGYVISGSWAKGAFSDAKPYGEVYSAFDGANDNFTRMPLSEEIQIKPDTRYLHITSNETIGGIRFPKWPDVDVPLIADMSSEYMSRPVPFERFDLIYGGVQKNLGPAGLAVVFIRKSVIAGLNTDAARYLRYDIQYDKDSMFNTPPVFAIYLLGKMLKWMEGEGGLDAMEQAAEEKSSLLYDAIDQSDNYYNCPVDVSCRSRMNIVFRLPREELETEFVKQATASDLLNLKGHRSVGGLRASIYNAMPIEGVRALVEFMKNFRERHLE
ncbi:MAG: phosphoserine aminotransferase [marine bacterium B5-7]|nr:MAG: phosphoserine aminotransferase [marine bacterium B5-7]